MKRAGEETDEGGRQLRAKTSHDTAIEPESVKALFNWAIEHGAIVDSFHIVEKAGCVPERWAEATRDIGEGDLFAHLPERLILSESTARQSASGSSVFKYMAEHPEETKESLGEKDPYAAGTNVYYIVKERQKLLRNASDLVKKAFMEAGIKETVDYQQFLWAYCAIASRAFPKASGGVVKPEDGSDTKTDSLDPFSTSRVAELCLYPVLDMLNHKRDRKIEWNSVVKPGISFVAKESTSKGDVLWNNYGPKGNEVAPS
ncbi:hypothetical protein HDU96_004581 [Phlyctochytrium bullatum]|nr:hypothetical protein HDU96_004581 [Phlyctochytrium bullatum]